MVDKTQKINELIDKFIKNAEEEGLEELDDIEEYFEDE